MRPIVRAITALGSGSFAAVGATAGDDARRKIGRDKQAQAELTTAVEMYRGMEMTFWLARAEVELGQITSAP